MENISYTNHLFTVKKMIPNIGDELTFLWGRRIVQNLVNSYGMIGTMKFEGTLRLVAYNLNLTKVFRNPPIAHFYFKNEADNTLWYRHPWTPFIPYCVSDDVLWVRHPAVDLGDIYFRLIG
jgi:hypothetical protein